MVCLCFEENIILVFYYKIIMFNIKRFSKEISFTSDHTDLTNQNCDKQIALKELPTPMKRCI